MSFLSAQVYTTKLTYMYNHILYFSTLWCEETPFCTRCQDDFLTKHVDHKTIRLLKTTSMRHDCVYMYVYINTYSRGLSL